MNLSKRQLILITVVLAAALIASVGVSPKEYVSSLREK